MSRTAEEWGRVAVSLPGWRWMMGMGDFTGLIVLGWVDPARGKRLRCWDIHMQCTGDYSPARLLPDSDDLATAGCLLALLGRQVSIRQRGHWVAEWRGMAPLAPGMGSVKREVTGRGPTLGRACIAAAEALGRWPGGAE